MCTRPHSVSPLACMFIAACSQTSSPLPSRSVVLYYDYFLVLSDEIEFFWRRGNNRVAKFFLFTRYLCLVGNIPIAVQLYSRWSQAVSVEVFVRVSSL